jgi:hypothetical protein
MTSERGRKKAERSGFDEVTEMEPYVMCRRMDGGRGERDGVMGGYGYRCRCRDVLMLYIGGGDV